MSAAPPIRIRQHSKGYRIVYAPGHPLGTSSKPDWVYEHRFVFFTEHGEGPFQCHWCGAEVTWPTLNVDHLDDRKDHNHPGNLVASCRDCNVGRAKAKAAAGRRASRGRWIEFGGARLVMADWARRMQMAPQVLAYRLDAGWTVEHALTAPRHSRGRRAPMVGR